jgi:hypothetical protein
MNASAPLHRQLLDFLSQYSKAKDLRHLRGCLKSLVKKLPKPYAVDEISKYYSTKPWEYQENHIPSTLLMTSGN